MRVASIILDPTEGELAPLAKAVGEAVAPDGTVAIVSRRAALERALAEAGEECVAFADLELGDGRESGVDLVRGLRRLAPRKAIVAVCGHGDVATAASAIDAGATDFLVRSEPLGDRVATLLGKLRPMLRLLAENEALREQNRRLAQEYREKYRIVGESPAMIDLMERVKRVAAIPRPILVEGERGTGKELVARAIHQLSGRAAKPLVTVNCAAFPDHLLESELFGHERGAFTSADRQMPGRFEAAEGGTLFLDEISHMSPAFQQKILRVVEYGSFMRVGGRVELRTTARIIAATNVDLRRRIGEGAFLADLYDRLSFEVIRIPPLRERRGDIPVLARHLLHDFLHEVPALGAKRLSPAALDLLARHPFNGNVRELKNIIERAAYRDKTNEITPEDIGRLEGSDAVPSSGGFEERMRAFKQQMLRDALDAAEGNKAEAARQLGLTYEQFRYHWRSVPGEA